MSCSSAGALRATESASSVAAPSAKPESASAKVVRNASQRAGMRPVLAILATALAVSACGGGTTPAAPAPTTPAPTVAAPNIGNADDQSLTVNTALAAPIVFSNSGGAVASCAVDNTLPAGLSLSVSTGSPASCQITGEPTSTTTEATYTITATNTAGSNTATIKIAVTGGGLGAPLIANEDDQKLEMGTALASAIVFTNTGGATASCAANPMLPAGLTLAPSAGAPASCQISGTPTATAVYTVHTVTATNATGDHKADIGISVVDPAATSPIISAPDPITLAAGADSGGVVLGNTGLDATACAVDSSGGKPGLPAGLSIGLTTVGSPVGCQITGTPSAFTAAAIVTISVESAMNPATLMLSIAVNAAPAIANAPVQHLVKDAALEPAIVFANNGGSADSCAVDPALPAGLAVSAIPGVRPSCQITGTPTAGAAQATYTVTAMNGIDSDSAEIVLSVVDPAATDPLIPAAASFTLAASVASAGLIFPNAGADVTGCSDDGNLPAGLSVGMVNIGGVISCQITGTATAATTAAVTVSVTATSAAGTATTMATINVIAIDAPIIADAGNQDLNAGAAIAAPVVFANTGGNASSCAVSPYLPAGLSLALDAGSPVSCQITGEPTAGSAQATYTVTATNPAGSESAEVVIAVLAPPSLAPADAVAATTDIAIAPIVFANSGGSVQETDGCVAVPANSEPSGLTLARVQHPGGAYSCQLSGTPDTAAAAANLTVRGVNAAGMSDAVVSIAVAAPVAATAAPALADFTENQALVLDQAGAIVFNNEGGDATTCAAAGGSTLPGGLAVSAVSYGGKITCRISGTPTALQAAPGVDITVEASNAMSGGTADTADVTILVNPPAPSLAAVAEQNLSLNTALAENLVFANTGGAAETCASDPALPAGLMLGPDSADPAGCQISGTPTAASARTTHTISAVNAGGSGSAGLVVSVADGAATAPVIADPGPITIFAGRDISIVLGNTGLDAESCVIDTSGSGSRLPAGLSIGLTTTPGPVGCIISGIVASPTAATAIVVTVNATDGNSMAVSDEVMLSITVAAPAPALADAPALILTKDTALAASVEFGNSGGSAASCSASPGLPAGLQAAATTKSPASCEITGTPTAVAAQATYTITATNAAGSDTAAISITVNDVVAAAAPVLADADAAMLTAGEAIATAIEFDNTGGPVAACESSPSLPSGLSVSANTAPPATCQITGTPDTAVAQMTYTITGRNAGGSDTAMIDITVDAATLAAPALDNATDVTAVQNIAITPTVFVNRGGDAATCEVDTRLPNGLTLAPSDGDPASCRISGTPDTVSGRATYTVTAANTGGSNTATVVITVNAPGTETMAPGLQDVADEQVLVIGKEALITFENTGGSVQSGGCALMSGQMLPDGLDLIFATNSGKVTCQITGTPTKTAASAMFTVEAVNAINAGGAANTATVTIIVNPAAPDLPDSAIAATVIDGESVSQSLANAGGPADSCVFVVASAETATAGELSAAVSSDGTACGITGALSLASGGMDQSFTVRATNTTGSDEATINFTVNPVAPSLSAADDVEAINGVLITPVIFANAGGDAASCSVDNELPSGLMLDLSRTSPVSCRITGTPTGVKAQATYMVTATNATASSMASVDITVSAPLAVTMPPILGSITGNLPLAVGTQATITFENTGDDVMACALAAGSVLPDGLNLVTATDSGKVTCQITGMPIEVVESPGRTITVEALNSANAGDPATATVAIIVNPQVPDLATAGVGNGVQNTQIAPIVFVNRGGAATSCDDGGNLPEGLSLDTDSANPTGCQITGTPLATGIFNVTVTARNAGGSSTSSVFISITIPAPNLASPNPAVARLTQNEAIANPIVFANSDSGGAATLCLSSPALPSGLIVRPDSADPAGCQITGTPLVPTASPTLYTITAQNLTNPNPGLNTPASATVTIFVQQAAPELTSPPAQNLTKDTALASPISFVNSGGSAMDCESNPNLPAGLTVRTNSSTPTGCEIIGTPTAAVAQMTYTITASNAGGGSAEAMIVITVAESLDPPMLGIVAPVSATQGVAISTITFVNTGGEAASCSVNPALPEGLSVTRNSASPAGCQISGLPTRVASVRPYEVTATNGSGSSMSTVRITVNAGPPSLSNAVSGPLTVDEQITPIVFANEGGAAVSCADTTGLPNGLTVAPDSADPAGCVITGTPRETAGLRTYLITATNAGGATHMASVSFRVLASPPALADLEAVTLRTGEAIIDPIVFTNTGGDATFCSSMPNLPFGLLVDFNADSPATCQITGTPRVAAEEFTYTITAEGGGNQSSSARIPILVELSPPNIENAASESFVQGTAISPIVFANTGEAATACTPLTPLPLGLSLSLSLGTPTGCRITGTPQASAAFTTYMIRATNGGGRTSTASVSFSVSAIAPAISDLADQNLDTSRDITPIIFTNTGGAATSCASSATLPTGLSLGLDASATPAGCRITGRPTAASARRLYTITATNNAGSDTSTVNISVIVVEVENIPVLANPAAQVYTQGTSITPVTFTNAGGPVATCAVMPGLPAGLSVTARSGTCRISGRPAASAPQNTYTVTGANTGGGADATIVITVEELMLEAAPVLVSPGDQSLVQGVRLVSPISFVNNNGGVAVECEASPSLPAGLLVIVSAASPAGCQITGSPDAQSVQRSYTIIATNADGIRGTVPVLIEVTEPVAPDGSAKAYGVGVPDLTAAGPYILRQGTEIGSVSAAIVRSNSGNPNVFHSVSEIFISNAGGEVGQCLVEPALPAGLSIRTVSGGEFGCEIVGAPAAASEAQDYIVIGTTANPHHMRGGASAVIVNIAVRPSTPVLETDGRVFFNLVQGTTLISTNDVSLNTVQILNLRRVTGSELTACDADDNTPLPSGLTLELTSNGSVGCHLSGTPDMVTPRASYTIIATNQFGSDAITIDLAVSPQPPSLTDIAKEIFPDSGVGIPSTAFINAGGPAESCESMPELPTGLMLAVNSADPASCTLSGTPTQSIFLTTFTVTAINDGGRGSATVAIGVGGDEAAPVLANARPQSLTKDVRLRRPIRFDNTGGAVIECSVLPDLPEGLVVSRSLADPAGCQITGTPTEAATGVIYVVRARNSHDDDGRAEVFLTVIDPANLIAPNLGNAAIQELSTGESIDPASPIAFPNLGGSVTNCLVSPELPEGLELGTNTETPISCQITGTPTEAAAQREYDVTADNSAGSSMASVIISVAESIPLIAPALADAPDTAGIVNVAFTPIVFENTGGNVDTCAEGDTGLPLGLSLSKTATSPVSCQITGTPEVALADSAPAFSIKATNDEGSDTAEIDFSITALVDVPNAVQAPNLTSRSDAALVLGQNRPLIFLNSGGDVLPTFTHITNEGQPNEQRQRRGGCLLKTGSDDLPDGLVLESVLFDGVVTCQISGVPENLVATRRAISFTGNNAVTGATGTPSEVSIGLTVSLGAPALADIGARIVMQSSLITPIVFANTGGDVVDCSISPALPAGLVVETVADGATETCQISGTPTRARDAANYTVSGANLENETDMAVIQLTVNPVAPALAAPAAAVLPKDVQITPIQLINSGGSVRAANGCAISQTSASPLPTGLSIERYLAEPDLYSCRIVGTPSVVSSAVNVTIEASNNASAVTVNISITITLQGPIFADIEETMVERLKAITPIVFENSGGGVLLAINASPTPGCEVTPALPEGLALSLTGDGNSCQITGTPAAELTGAVSYSVRGTNVDGTGSPGRVRITVIRQADADSNGLMEIYTLDELYNVRFGLSGTSYKTAADATELTTGCPTAGCFGYELKADLDFDIDGDGSTWAVDTTGNVALDSGDAARWFNASTGWAPIGGCGDGCLDFGGSRSSNDGPFAAVFEGNGLTISNLAVLDTADSTGMFALLGAEGQIRNLGLIDNVVKQTSTTSNDAKAIGGLVGISDGVITASYTTGPVYGSLATGSLGNSDWAGGLVGLADSGSAITGCYASGAVFTGAGGSDRAGGLVGSLRGGSISASYALGNVDAGAGDNDRAGGLVGNMPSGVVSASYAAGAVDGGSGSGDSVNRLLGSRRSSTVISNSWGYGRVLGGEDLTAGLAGSPANPASSAVGITGTPGGWDDFRSLSAGAWDTGGTAQLPNINYADYDGESGSDYICADAVSRSIRPPTIVIANCGKQLPSIARDFSLRISSPEAGRVTLSWGAIPGITTYVIRRATNSFFGGEILIPGLGDVSTTLDVPFSDATPYYFRIQACVSTNDCTSFSNSVAYVTPVAVDNDQDGLIDIRTLTELYNMRFSLDGSGYKESANAEKQVWGCPSNACKGYELLNNLNFNRGGRDTTWTISGPNVTLESADNENTYFPVASRAPYGGWPPIGTASAPFNTVLEGNGNTIANLAVSLAPPAVSIGLFAYTGASSVIRNLGLSSALADYHSRVSGGSPVTICVGALAGRNQGDIINSWSTGRIEGSDSGETIGGLVGCHSNGLIIRSRSSAAINARSEIHAGDNHLDRAGGLVGRIDSGTIAASWRTGPNVDAGEDSGRLKAAGGLAGHMRGGRIIASFSTSDLLQSGNDQHVTAGGLVGLLEGGSIVGSYSTGDVTGGPSNVDRIGGLVGLQSGGGLITASWYNGTVSGRSRGPVAADHDYVALIVGLGDRQTRLDANIDNYGYGRRTSFNNGGQPHHNGNTKPLGAANTPADLSAQNVPGSWNQASSLTAGLWNFDGTSGPRVQYADYDGSGGVFHCQNSSQTPPANAIIIPVCGVEGAAIIIPDQPN